MPHDAADLGTVKAIPPNSVAKSIAQLLQCNEYKTAYKCESGSGILLTEWPRFHRPTESFPAQPQSIEVLLRGSH